MSRKEQMLVIGEVRFVSVESSEKPVGKFVAVTGTPQSSSCLAVKYKRYH